MKEQSGGEEAIKTRFKRPDVDPLGCESPGTVKSEASFSPFFSRCFII